MDKRHQREETLSWNKSPRGTWIISEMIRSDAYRSLSKSHSDIWLFILTRRDYPKPKKRDYWQPTNKNKIKIPAVAIREFLNGEIWDMTIPSPNYDTCRRAFIKFMEVGFLSLVYLGGSGKGDQSIYRLEDAWRTWKKGNPACFTREGMCRNKGFIKPGSGKFYEAARN